MLFISQLFSSARCLLVSFLVIFSRVFFKEVKKIFVIIVKFLHRKLKTIKTPL